MSNYTKSTNFATKDNLTPGDPLKVVRGTEIDTEFNNIATAVATKTDNASAAITGGSITGITDLAVADGGTGASTAAGGLNNLLPSQTGNANKYLQTDGTNATWDAVSLSTADITGTLPVANGGTGVTSSTGTGSVVLSNSPTLVTPALGTPASGTATNLTGLPISTGVSGLGTGVATFLGTPSSANLASAVTDETGSGALVFANSPTLVTPALGTPSALVGTNITGTASGLTAGNVTTNANLTGAVTSSGNATSLGSFSSANLLGALTDETGTGSAVFATSPTLVTPILGTPTSATLTNATGLPIATGVSGLGTGVATFLATPSSANLAAALTDETGSGANVFATSPTLVTPILGTPTSATLTNATGLPLTTGVTGTLPTANGGTNLTSFTSGGVVYASSSSALATGSALTFDGANLGIGGSATRRLTVIGTGNDVTSGGIQTTNTNGGTGVQTGLWVSNGTQSAQFGLAGTGYSGYGAHVAGNAIVYNDQAITLMADNASTGVIKFAAGGNTEGMRLTSTGLGIGTSSPAAKLHVFGNGNNTSEANASAYIGGGSTEMRIYFGVNNSSTYSYIGSYQQGITYRDLVLQPNGGNLGLGVTPSGWSSGGQFQFADNKAMVSSGAYFNVGTNWYYNGGFRYISSTTATNYEQALGSHKWYTAASGTAGNIFTFTQAMTLDASGNLMVGATSQVGSSKLGVQRSSAGEAIRWTDGSTGGFLGTVASVGCEFNFNSALLFKDGSTEKARIDSSGNLLVGTTSNPASAKTYIGVVYDGQTEFGSSFKTTYTSGIACNFLNSSGTQVGKIDTSGSATSYVTSSDYRLKNTIAPMTGALAKVAQLNPVTYKWNLDGSDGQGFIAHELAEVVPDCVSGEKDAVDQDGNPVYQGIDTSFLVATLTSALQELNAKFEAYVASHP